MKTIFTLRAYLLLSFILAVSVQGYTQNFTSGNIVVSKVGDGITPIIPDGVSLPVVLEEYEAIAGSSVKKTVTLNSSGAVSIPKLTLGTNNGEGQLKLSLDGGFITLIGYNSVLNNLASTHRGNAFTVGKIDIAGAVTLSPGSDSPNSSTRSAVSIDGVNSYIKRDLITTPAGNLINVTVGASRQNVATFGNQTGQVRTLELFKNILFACLGTSYDITYSSTVGSRTLTGVTSMALPMDLTGAPATKDLCGFVFLDTDNNIATGWNSTGLDALYIADQANGIIKFNFNGSQFKYIDKFNTFTGASNITGRMNGNNKELFFTSGNGNASTNNLIMLTDATANSALFNGPTVTIIKTAPANYAFRGVAFSPSITKTWTGTTSTDYNTGSNWSGGIAPAASDFIVIPTGLPRYPVLTANTTIASGTIAPGASVTVNEGKTLTVVSSLSNNGNLILKSGTSGTANLLSSTTIANVTQQRYLGSNQRGWRLLSNPLSSATYGTVATGSTTPIQLGNGTAKTYDPVTNLWTISNTDDTQTWASQSALSLFIRGKASEVNFLNYSVATPSNVTLAIKGEAKNTAPATVATTAGRYYLVANPYTSPVSVSSILTASSGLSTTIAYYNPTIGSDGSNANLKIRYGGYNSPIVSGAAGSASDVVIPPMGAFFVQAASTGTINVPKVAIFTGTPLQTGTYNHKPAQVKSTSTPQIKVEVISDGAYYDAVAVQFKPEDDAGITIDFGKLENTILDAYTIAGTEKMAVSELELKPQTIPLGITSTIEKNYTFKVVENTIPAGYEAVLADKVLNTNTPMVPGTNYSFAIDSTPASQGDARFAINLKTAGTLSISENVLASKIQLWPNPARGQFNITNSLNAKEGPSTIEISTVTGQVIHTQKSDPGSVTTIQTNGWATGVYILKATNNGTQTTKKLIIQ